MLLLWLSASGLPDTQTGGVSRFWHLHRNKGSRLALVREGVLAQGFVGLVQAAQKTWDVHPVIGSLLPALAKLCGFGVGARVLARAQPLGSFALSEAVSVHARCHTCAKVKGLVAETRFGHCSARVSIRARVRQ